MTRKTLVGSLVAATLLGLVVLGFLRLLDIVPLDEDRPTIRVRNGSSIEMVTEPGTFTRDDKRWRQDDRDSAGPKRLEVSTTGAATCTPAGPLEGKTVDVVYSTDDGERRVAIEIRNRYLKFFRPHVYVTPDADAKAEVRNATLTLGPGTNWRLLRVEVGPRSCTFTVPAADNCVAIRPRAKSGPPKFSGCLEGP